MNTGLFQMLKKESWIIDMILLIYFLKHVLIMSGLKMKKPTDITSRNIDKDKSVDLSDMPTLEGDEEVKEGKELKN